MIGMLLYPYFSTLIGWVHVILSQTMQKVEFFVVVVFLIFNFAATVLAKTVAPKFSHALRKKFL